MALVFQFFCAILPLKQQLLNQIAPPTRTQCSNAWGYGGGGVPYSNYYNCALKILVMYGLCPMAQCGDQRTTSGSWFFPDTRIPGIKCRSSVLATSTFLHPLSHLTSLHSLTHGFSLGPGALGLGWTGRPGIHLSLPLSTGIRISQGCRGSHSTPPAYTACSLPAISKAPGKLTLWCWACSVVSVESHCDW